MTTKPLGGESRSIDIEAKEELNKLWDEVIEKNSSEEPDGAEESDALREEEEEEKEGIDRVEDGDPSDTEETPSDDLEMDDEESSEKEGDDPEVEVSPDRVEPLEQFPSDVKEEWDNLTPTHQKFLVLAYKNMQADYTRKTQEIAGVKKALEPIRKELEDSGVDDATAVNELVSASMLLDQAPHTALKYLMETYQVTPQDLIDNWENPQDADERRSPEIAKRRRQLAEARRAAKEKAESGQKKWEEFASKYEHANLLRPYMMALAHSHFSETGEVPSLERLYDEALWSAKDTREIALSKKRLAERSKVNKAKKAKKTVKRSTVSDGETAPPKEMSLREELTATYDKLSRKAN